MQEKAGRYYYVLSSGEFANKPRWIPLGTGDYSEALERWAAVEIEVQQNSTFDISKIDLGSRAKVTLGKLISEFFEEGDGLAESVKKRGKKKPHGEDDDKRYWAKKTLTNYLRMGEELKKYFGVETVLHKITRQNILIYKRKLRSKPYETNRRIGLLRLMLQQAVDHGYINTNPADRIKKYPEKKHTLRLTEEILFKKIYPVSDPMLKRAIMLGFHCVQRENEVKNFKWTDFDFRKNIVRFNRKKTGEPITINFSTNKTLLSFFDCLRSDTRELSPFIICHPSKKRGGCRTPTFAACGQRPSKTPDLRKGISCSRRSATWPIPS
jgi:hypothetical protein